MERETQEEAVRPCNRAYVSFSTAKETVAFGMIASASGRFRGRDTIVGRREDPRCLHQQESEDHQRLAYLLDTADGS